MVSFGLLVLSFADELFLKGNEIHQPTGSYRISQLYTRVSFAEFSGFCGLILFAAHFPILST